MSTKVSRVFDVWSDLDPSNIVVGGKDSGLQSLLASMAKFFFAVAIICLVVTSFIAIGYYAFGGSKKGEGKDLLMSKLLIAIVISLGVGLLNAIFITATGMW